MSQKLEAMSVKVEPYSPSSSIIEHQSTISIAEEDYDEINKMVAEWVRLNSRSEIFCKCEKLRQDNEVVYFTKSFIASRNIPTSL